MFKHCLNMVTQELIKPIVKLGNSACVLLPKAWINGKARIELIEKPINIKQNIFQILNPYLEDILGIYLIGSYAREEQTKKSDIDVLVLTNKTNKRIEKGKYEIILISKEDIERKLKNNILPILPMIKEAKPLLNSTLINQYKDTKLTKKNLKFHIETTKSAMNIIKETIKLSKEMRIKEGDGSAYSLILRLREIYIIDCLIKNKKQNKQEFLNLIKKIAGSLEAYKGYVRCKNNEKYLNQLSIKEAEKIMNYILKNIKNHKEWINKNEKKKKINKRN